MKANSLDDVISLCKRRGIIYQSSDIYGGLQGVYDYGPLGVEIKQNLKSHWWNDMVHMRDDVVGLDSSILTHNLTLKHSGHKDTFTDPMIDCKDCKMRFRADFITDSKCLNANCRSSNLTDPREFNLMMETHLGPLKTSSSMAYLRPETAQGIFINFKNVTDSMPVKIPFGIAQIGKAFRNEITPKNFIFRVREFEQMEMEFFVKKGEDEKWHEYWINQRLKWWQKQGIDKSNLILEKQAKDDLSHYSKATTDILYKFPHGVEEIEGIANRTDFDLGSHSKEQESLNLTAKTIKNNESTSKMVIEDPKEKIFHTPFVIEPSCGVDRGVLSILCEGYQKETLENGSNRIVLKIAPHLSPVKAAVIPLAKNNSEIVSKSKKIQAILQNEIKGKIAFENTGNIGKAYRRHDEIGTPSCITIDFETIGQGDIKNNDTVTIRDRDLTKQTRIPIENIAKYLIDKNKYQG